MKDQYFGRDCPKGMVQVAFVGCAPGDKRSEYGWKPVESTFIEIYVDGMRYSVQVGDFHDGKSQKRGLHIVTDTSVSIEKTSLNACSVFIEQDTK